MTFQSSDYETAKKSLRRKLLPGLVILLILVICIFLLLARKNAPAPPSSTQTQAARP